MKKIILALGLMTAALGATAQNTTHVMQKGETVESIARKYGISTDELLRLNPDAKTFVYVGMKFAIPSKQATTTTPDAPAATVETPSTAPTQYTAPAQYTASDYSAPSDNSSSLRDKLISFGSDYENLKGTGCITMELAFNHVRAKIIEDANFGFQFGWGYRYYVHDNIFAEMLFGYKMHAYFDSDKTDHMFTLPIHIGVSMPVTEHAGVGLFVGPRVDFPFLSKFNGHKIDHGDPSCSFDVGLQFRYNDVIIRPTYSPGLGKYNKTHQIGLIVSYGF